jgi:hypothetical protein
MLEIIIYCMVVNTGIVGTLFIAVKRKLKSESKKFNCVV